MHFIIIYKKKNFDNNLINHELLNSIKSPSLISNDVVKCVLGDFIIYLYLYDHIYREKENYSFSFDNENFLLVNGIINVDGSERPANIIDLFKSIDEGGDLVGDYQLISLNSSGEGDYKTPPSSIKKLFYYEDDKCSVISTEIKLIVDGIEKFRKRPFKDHYDATYIYDTFYNGAFLKYPRHTIFKKIRRVFPHDSLKITNNGFLPIKNDTIIVPNWFKKWYLEDKEGLYCWYYEKLLNYSEMFLKQYKKGIESINVGLTGGFDSRLTVLILKKVTDKIGIPLKSHTSGNEDHPDVILAKMIAEKLDIDWTNQKLSNNLFPAPQNLNDYSSSFYLTQCDFDSRDFIKSYNRKINNSKVINQNGMDSYKRGLMPKICSANIWFSRVNLFKSNFFLPLFFTKYETWFALLLNDEVKEKSPYKEFIYYVLKRGNEELLEIPFAGDFLPQINIDSFGDTSNLTTAHNRESFFWDYNLVKDRLNPALKKRFNILNNKYKFLLKIFNINELDFFLVKDMEIEIKKFSKLTRIEKMKSTRKFMKKLRKLKEDASYPKGQEFIEFNTKIKNYGYVSRLTQFMDYASAANCRSFVELEKQSSFYFNDN